jgi:hypothetical protein
MGFMLAAWPDGHFEFFAQAHQKTLTAATLETSPPCKKRNTTLAHKKARREAGCEVQGKVREPETLTVVGRFAV